MKTIILMTMMLLTVAFARLASAQELTIFNGYTVAVETAQIVGDELLIDGSGNGNSTLGMKWLRLTTRNVGRARQRG